MTRETQNRQRGRPARIELTCSGVEVYAPASQELRELLATLDAHFVPGHWSVDAGHLDEVAELVAELHPVSVVDTRGAA